MSYDVERSVEHSRRVTEHMRGVEKGSSRRQMKSTRKRMKRNLRPRGPRPRDFMGDSLEDWEALGYAQHERIMPRDERDRRLAVEQAAFRAPGAETDASEAALPNVEGRRGTVVAVSGELCRVELGASTRLCHVRGTLTSRQTEFTNAVAVGDEVIVSEDGAGGGVIEAVLPRRGALTRPDVFYSHLRQVIVANAHQLLIVSSWREPVIWLELIDRYLIAAERSGLLPVICVNKVDLVEDEASFEATFQPYNGLGHRLIATSALTGEGIDELRAALQGKTTVLTGLSGTGKSSLLAAVQPGLRLRTGEVSIRSGEGRHTTTQATMLRVDVGGAVVDTPGIREFGLAGLRRHELARFFPEIAAVAAGCRFSDCSHIGEPDCAVLAANATGAIAPSRYHSYLQIHPTLPE